MPEISGATVMTQAPPRDEKLEPTFERLAAQWRDETEHFSFVARRLQHPAYQQILQLGPDVVPLILREMQQRPDQWFAALRQLTGEDPVPPGSTVSNAVDAWLSWGKERRYLTLGG